MNVLITGANSGFGLLTVKRFAAAGHIVHAGYRSREKASELQQLAAESDLVQPIHLDVTDQATIDAAVQQAQSVAPVDVLVNNAGFEVAGPVDSLSDDLLHRQFDTNVFGVVRMIRAVAPQMRERRQGSIVNLSSVLGWLTVPYAAAYAASKHAVESLSEALWYELAPFGIRVAVIEPGVFPTNFGNNVVSDPGLIEGSPHWPHAQRFRTALHAMFQASPARPNSQEVADVVFEAATTETPRFRYVAGDDARALIPAYKSQEFETFRTATLARLGLPDWDAA